MLRPSFFEENAKTMIGMRGWLLPPVMIHTIKKRTFLFNNRKWVIDLEYNHDGSLFASSILNSGTRGEDEFVTEESYFCEVEKHNTGILFRDLGSISHPQPGGIIRYAVENLFYPEGDRVYQEQWQRIKESDRARVRVLLRREEHKRVQEARAANPLWGAW